MKKSMVILLLASSFFLDGFAQKKHPLLKGGYAFYTISTPGMAMTDDNGNIIAPKPNIDRFMYVEAVGTKPPEIVTVMYDKAQYAPVFTKVNERAVHVGNGQNGSEITLVTRKGYSFWKIDLRQVNEIESIPGKVKDILVIYKGRLGDRRSPVYRINKETRLLTPDRY